MTTPRRKRGEMIMLTITGSERFSFELITELSRTQKRPYSKNIKKGTIEKDRIQKRYTARLLSPDITLKYNNNIISILSHSIK